MAITQVQFRLSIDGKQALSEMSALELKMQETASENKKYWEEKTAQEKIYKEALLESAKVQERQQQLMKSMAVASESGNLVQLTKLEKQYEANEEKLTTLLDTQVAAGIELNKNNDAIAENNKAMREQKARLEELYLAEGDVLRQDSALIKEKRALTREIQIAGNNSERQIKAQSRLAEIEKELSLRVADRAKATVAGIQKIIKEEGLEKVSTQQLIELQKALEVAEKHRIDRSSEGHKEEIENIRKVKEELKKRDEEKAPEDPNGGGFLGMLKNVKSGIMPGIVGGLIGTLSGGIIGGAVELFGKLASSFGETIDRIKTKAQEITAIQTSLDISRNKAREINKDLGEIDTTTSVAELNKLVEVAGDLNEPIDNIQNFVTKADQIGTVMGKEMGGIEESVTMISKLKEEFKQTRDLKTDEALQRIGSMLKQLNLAGPATTQGITEFLKRVGNIPDAIKPSITQLAGFAAVFEEANLSSEISATAFANILTVGANNINTFAKQMRISTTEVRNLINENPNEFVLQFAKSLQGLKGDKLAQTLKILHLEGSEAFKTIGVLTDNLEKVRQKQDLANQSMQDGTTIQRIFNEINNDEAAKIEKIGKSWDKVKGSMTSWVAFIIGPAINALADLTKKTETMDEAYRKQEEKTKFLTQATKPLVEKYWELGTNMKRTKEQQQEFETTVSKLGKIVPEAVTQWGNYGQAIQVNIGIVEEAIKKQQQLQNLMKKQYIQNYTNEDNKLWAERADLMKQLNEFTSIQKKLQDPTTQAYERGRLELRAEQMKKGIGTIQDRITTITNKVKENIEAKKKLDEFATIAEPPKPDGKGGNTNTGGNGGLSKDPNTGAIDPNRILKFEQEQHDNLTELQDKLAYEERLALADEKEKRLLIVEHKADEETAKVKQQFKDINGLILTQSQWSKEQKEVVEREQILIQNRLNAEKLDIQKEFIRKEDELFESHANHIIQLAQDTRKEELSMELNLAKKSGNRTEQYIIQKTIINTDQSGEEQQAKLKYLKEYESAKENANLLKIVEEDYQKTLEAIKLKYDKKRAENLDASWENEKQINQKNRLTALQLDTTDPHKNAFLAKKALLEAEHQAELENAEKTGADIANINRKYAQSREALEHEHLISVAEKAVQYYEQAFSTILNIAKANTQNRMTQEQLAYDRSIAQLDSQKNNGLKTNRQYNKEREKLEKDHAKKENALKKEQFEQEKIATISSIIMQTALAVMKAAPNVPLQILTGITGAAQLAIAAEQASPYSQGGIVKEASKKLSTAKKPSPTSVLAWLNEEGTEFVANAKAVQNPAWAIFEPILNDMNQGKTIKGLATGGYHPDSVTTPRTIPFFSEPNTTSNQANNIQLEQFNENVKLLSQSINSFVDAIKQPISANVAIGSEEIYKLEQERERLNNSLSEAYMSTSKSLI